MSEDTVADLLEDLPERLQARAGDLEAYLDGSIGPEAKARLHDEAESDEDLARALELFAPFESGELDAISALVHDNLPAFESAGADDGEQEARPVARTIRPLRTVTASHPVRMPTAPQRPPRGRPRGTMGGARGGWSGRIVVGLFAAMVAGVGFFAYDLMAKEKAAYRVVAKATTVSADQQARFELTPLRDGVSTERAVVLAVSGETVKRVPVLLRTEGGTLVAEAAVDQITGGLYGEVQLLFLGDTKEDHPLDAEQVRSMISAFGDRAAAELKVQPPMYALATQAEGTYRGAADPVETASTAVEEVGKVTFNLRPATRAEGALALHTFVARDGAAPVPVAFETKSARGAFLLSAPNPEVLKGASRARVHFVVGPKGLLVDPARLSEGAYRDAPWQHVVHDLFVTD